MAAWQKDRNGSARMQLSKTLVLTAYREIQSASNPSPTPYCAVVFGARITRRFASLEEAQTAAINLAKSELAAAKTAMPT